MYTVRISGNKTDIILIREDLGLVAKEVGEYVRLIIRRGRRNIKIEVTQM